MRTTVLLAVLVPLAAVLGGCASWQRHASKYQTVVGDPHRDEASAKKKCEQASKAWQLGNLARAEQLLQEALIADVQYGPAHNNLGLLYYQTGRYYLAAWEFEYALQAMGERPEPHNNLGLVFEAVDRNEDAIRCYADARDLDSTNAEYVGNLARALFKRNEHDPAARELLSELLMYDSRPDWVAWAREKLAVGKFDGPTAASHSREAEVLPPPLVEPAHKSDSVISDELVLPPP